MKKFIEMFFGGFAIIFSCILWFGVYFPMVLSAKDTLTVLIGFLVGVIGIFVLSVIIVKFIKFVKKCL